MGFQVEDNFQVICLLVTACLTALTTKTQARNPTCFWTSASCTVLQSAMPHQQGTIELAWKPVSLVN